jgi:hypothetical protein
MFDDLIIDKEKKVKEIVNDDKKQSYKKSDYYQYGYGFIDLKDEGEYDYE